MPILYVDPAKHVIIPNVGDIVLARVNFVTAVYFAHCSMRSRNASLHILCVNGVAVTSYFRGTIRKNHVRAFEIDKVVMYNSFRIGDIVRARVISRGDRRSYFLATDRNDLGVILATSATGNPMIPVSWELMQCPETKEVEYRKVAKILTDDEIKVLKNKQLVNELVS